MTLNRRQMLLAAGAALLGPSALRALAAQKGGPTKKVLFFTKSSGFQHSVITRKDGKPALAERILTEIGKEHGFEVVASKDGRMFDPDKIGQWDAFAFETTGDLTKPPTMDKNDKEPPMSADGLKAFLDAIESGKGFVGMHCATDTFGDYRKLGADDPYIKMIGGEFTGHGAQQVATIEVADPSFPGVAGFGTGSFKINDEWYAQKYLADDLHVILVQETEGMTGQRLRAAELPRDLGPDARQGPRLLHLDGPPRRRLGEPQVPGPAPRRPQLGHRQGRRGRHAERQKVTPDYKKPGPGPAKKKTA